MGSVWKAYDTLLERTVAAKELISGIGGGEDRDVSRERVRRETLVLAKVEHPAIVSVHDLIFDGHGRDPWIVMAYVRGRSLEWLIREVPPLSDQKVANIVIGDDGAVRLVDFGVARIHGMNPLTSDSQLIGTPGFQAPELLSGRPPGPETDFVGTGRDPSLGPGRPVPVPRRHMERDDGGHPLQERARAAHRRPARRAGPRHAAQAPVGPARCRQHRRGPAVHRHRRSAGPTGPRSGRGPPGVLGPARTAGPRPSRARPGAPATPIRPVRVVGLRRCPGCLSSTPRRSSADGPPTARSPTCSPSRRAWPPRSSAGAPTRSRGRCSAPSPRTGRRRSGRSWTWSRWTAPDGCLTI